MTASEPQELLVLLEDYKQDKRYQLYDNFTIGPEDKKYILESTGKSIGDAGDSLEYHLGMSFSTIDRKNDWTGPTGCAQQFKGAWWFRSCLTSHLFGLFGEDQSGRGILWTTFRDVPYVMKRAQMMIRPRRVSQSLG
ncbi:uncharacterized protein Dere_GG24402 [Drosophila erecta]|uniref:Fibrinogen C-terminal domain-containing protein n=2 Tax=Drosophila erecta TaxID=7220 RepID=B3N381_DROER|nr:uncharacterized protein Dere_GG24402 [Drosophila erecta]